jgi:hypothetical protein
LAPERVQRRARFSGTEGRFGSSSTEREEANGVLVTAELSERDAQQLQDVRVIGLTAQRFS